MSRFPYDAVPHRAVMKTRKDTNHGLHLVLTILTCGMWGLCVWLPLTLWHRIGPRKKIVNYYR